MAWSSFIDNGVFVVKFYLRRRPYGTNSIEQIAHVSLPIGKLLYNTKTRSYFLMPGTRIAIPKRQESFEYTSIVAIYYHLQFSNLDFCAILSPISQCGD